MVSVGVVHILDAKIIDGKTERDGAHHVGKEPRGVGNRHVAVRGQVFYQAFVGNDARLVREDVDAFQYFNKVMVLMYQCREIVLGHNRRRNVADRDSHVLVAFSRIVEVAIF